MAKTAEEELAELKDLVRVVAKVLYRHHTWNELPWGAKQVLGGFLEGQEPGPREETRLPHRP